jgi:flagellar protein FlaG
MRPAYFLIGSQKAIQSGTSAMDSGSISKPFSAAVLNAPQRIEPLASAGAVKTELPPEDSVQQVAETAAVQLTPSEGAMRHARFEQVLQRTIEKRLVDDPRSREPVQQSVDAETGRVVHQVPDEALLRIRAYVQEVSESSVGRDRHLHRSA